jgi:hypothetical protein
MGTWWGDKMIYGMASAAENALYSSQEDETVLECVPLPGEMGAKSIL